jgi:hypothetical protein
MIVATPPQMPAQTVGCSFQELADDEVLARYRRNETDILASRQGSSFIRRMMIAWQMREKLLEAARVPHDCDSLCAEPPNRSAVAIAADVLASLVRSDLVPDGILPSAEGGIAICFVQGDKYADIECLNSGEVLAVTSTRHERPYVWSLDKNSVDSDSAAQTISTYLAT